LLRYLLDHDRVHNKLGLNRLHIVKQQYFHAYPKFHQIIAAEKITNKPIVAVFNTHVHGDHWLGNQAIVERYPAVKI
jgi:glyoxylase-like metal-dependent hydrolase (beta-lactamase superfamily II)